MVDPTKKTGSVKIDAPFQITGQPKQNQRFIKFMIYADYGAGKTTLASTAVDCAQMRDVIFVDAEAGQMTIDENDLIKNADLIDRIRVSNFKQIVQIQDFLKKHCILRDRGDDDKLRKFEAMYKGCEPEDIVEPKKYRTVIIDSLTEIDTFCLYQLLKLDTSSIGDVDQMEVAQFAEFRKNNQMLQLLVRAFRDLDMNVIIVCASQYTQDEIKRKHYAPNLTGKLASQIQGLVDVVGYLKTGKSPEDGSPAPRRLYVQPTGNFDAKNRRSQFKQAHIDNPNMTSIMQELGLTKKD